MSITQSDLECMILDEAAEPTAFPFPLLAEITDDFSKEIGRGGFAVVYKATVANGDIAVKRLSSNAYLYENEFHREIECLMKVKHKNIIRFLGYCADTQGNVGSYNGKFVMANLQHRLLCFEYLPNGSLHDYIEDASGGLEWRDRYKIIKGISEGLCYLHQKNILHLDLKPANILLDENMRPKITDFGLSRCFEEDQTQAIISKVIGTMGYLAPEYTSHVITHKFDLYSLGVIIMELLTGKKGYQDIENVLESWSSRLQKSQDNPEWEQIRVCAEIGLECTKFNPGKRPHSMKHIIDRLVETEGGEELLAAEPTAGPMDILSVHPLELCFPFEYQLLTSFSLNLTNNTNELVAFRLIMDGIETEKDPSYRHTVAPVNGIVPRRSTYTLVVPMVEDQIQAAEGNNLILQSTMLPLGDEEMIVTFKHQPDKFFDEVKDTGTNVVQEVRLKAVRTAWPSEIITSPSKPVSPGIQMLSTDHLYDSDMYHLDTNHAKQWIIAGLEHGKVRIWNNQTQKLVSSLKVSNEKVTCIKFIARQQWFVVGTYDGLIHVYNYENKMQKITSFIATDSSVESLVIHPTKPYLLLSCSTMKLWDWDKGWVCTQQFHATVSQKDTIAASRDHKVKIWSLNSPKSICTLSGHLDKVNCLDFFTCYDHEYLVTGSDDHTAKIWDVQKKKCVRTLEESMSPVTTILYEPKLNYLIIGSEDGCIYLWHATSSRINVRMPRLERIVNIGCWGSIYSLAYLMGRVRVVIGRGNTAAIISIDNNVNNLEASTDDHSEPDNYTTKAARDTTGKVMSSSSQLLDVALELICETNESISWLVHLTNSTDEHVAFLLMGTNDSKPLSKLLRQYGIVPSRSVYTLTVLISKAELAIAQKTYLDLVLRSSTSGHKYVVLFKDRYECAGFFDDAEEIGNDVHEVAILLKADYDAAQLEETKSKPTLIPPRIKIISKKNTVMELCCLDAHQTEPWIITGHDHGYVCTWNHKTQGPMDTFKVSDRDIAITCIKFIARKQWIVAMEYDGSINVYNYACGKITQKLTSLDIGFGGRGSLVVHPILPYVLSTERRVWDWEKGWECMDPIGSPIVTFAKHVAFNPKGDDSLATVLEVRESCRTLEVWSSIGSTTSDYTLSGHLKDVNCIDFFTRDDGQYLITGSDDCTAKIWDLQKRECIHTMEAIFSPVTCAISIPDRPYLITGSKHGTVQLWSSTDFRTESTVDLSSGGPIVGLVCFMGSLRVVIGQKDAVTIIEIDNEESISSERNN